MYSKKNGCIFKEYKFICYNKISKDSINSFNNKTITPRNKLKRKARMIKYNWIQLFSIFNQNTRETQKISGEQFINHHKKRVRRHKNKNSLVKVKSRMMLNQHMIKVLKIFGELFMVSLLMKLILKFKMILQFKILQMFLIKIKIFKKSWIK